MTGLIILTLGPMVLFVPSASAAPRAEDPSAVLVIMDVSGSMGRDDGTGTTLIDGAREAVNRFLALMPDATPVGLRVDGSEYPGDDQARGCRDSDLVVPVEPVSGVRDEITAAIGDARPTGFTPIGYALRQAADDFTTDAERTVILVSDGEDTCGNPPPCPAARRLAAAGVDVRVDTVGLYLRNEPAARRQLECVAEVTGGDYYDAENTGGLITALPEAGQRTVERYEGQGDPIEGGRSANDAAPVETGVPYTDDLAIGEARWYSFEAEDGQQITVTVTENGATEYDCCATLKALGPDLGQRGYDNGFNSDGTAHSYRVVADAHDTGTHYVEFALDAEEGRGSVDIEVQVDVANPAPDETTVPDETIEPSAPGDDPAPADATSTPETDGSSDTALWVLVAVLGVLVLGLTGAVLILFRRLGRGGSGPTS